MALHWEWENRIGEATLMQETNGENGEIVTEEFTLGLYEGNCMLIMLSEWTNKKGENMWSMFSFWAHADHMKSCLGLVSGETNMYDNDFQRITKFRINPNKSHNWKKFLPAIVQAFKHIEIEIVKE